MIICAHKIEGFFIYLVHVIYAISGSSWNWERQQALIGKFRFHLHDGNNKPTTSILVFSI
jgi:hypothetical protein